MVLVAPSILSADFLNLERDIRGMEEAGAKVLHVDVMDGHFVPNLTIGVPVIERIRSATDLLLDVHLMISNPELRVDSYLSAGADFLSVHYETVSHLDRLLEHIRQQEVRPGVVLNPHTPISVLEESLHKCHHVLIMSVNPGFGGQQFIGTSFGKVRKLKTLIRSQGLDVAIEIDGGMGPTNTREAVLAGVDMVVAGSAIFGSGEPQKVFSEMRTVAEAAAREREGG